MSATGDGGRLAAWLAGWVPETLDEREAVRAEVRAALAAAEARLARLEAALVAERATAMYLRDEVERFKDEGQAWPTRKDIAANLGWARLELEREGVLTARPDAGAAAGEGGG